MEKSKQQQKPMLLLLFTILCLVSSVQASGIFELSLTSLVDSLGRDLRDDCCAWQNASQSSSLANHHNQYLNHNHHQHQHQAVGQQQQQQQAVQCDPSKCQLIIRICVKNYQTQIEPTQCTFGELSAQVLKQATYDHFGLGSGAADSTLGAGNSLPVQYQPLLRRTAAAASTPRPFQRSPSSQPAATITNIHHQRMLSQTQAAASFQSPASSPLFYNSMHQQSAIGGAAARNSNYFNHQQQLGGASRSYLGGQPRALRTVAFHQPISFPFNFTWPGSFSLIIDAWFESPLQQVIAGNHLSQPSSPTTTYDLYKRQLIIKHSMRGWLAVKNEWTNDVHKTDTATLAYSYRVTCQTNYYGDQCNILCRPRDDFYGHYTCSQQGNIVCLPGWQGSYCLEPICTPGCHKDQGNCSRPNECSCRYGWQGPACEQCVLYPGCVHGSCNKPLECLCDEGWGGLLCNEDLNFCANHQPCKNDGICTNTFDSNGVGSYTCQCAPGYAGKNCERHNDGQQLDNSSAGEGPVSYVAALPSDTLLISGAAATAAAATTTTTTNNSSTISVKQQQQVSVEQQQAQAQQQQQQQQVFNKKSIKSQQQQQQQQQTKYNDLRQQQFLYPSVTTSAATINQNSSSGGSQLDSWVMIGWAVIMICSIILVLVFSFRTAIERASQRGGGRSHQWGGHHHGANQDQAGSHAEDVATLQNQQNLCKSRTSLNAAAAASLMAGIDHKSPAAYDRVLSLVDGHEHMAGIYGRYCPPSSSDHRYQQNNQTSDGSPSSRRGDKAKKSHQKHQQQQQQQQQQYRSQHNLHATHESNNNLDSSSSDAASSSSEALAPPPPYTIAQSTHSYPNLAYQTLSSHYSSAASAHYFPLPAAAAGQRAPKAGTAPQTTAISNALYGSYSTYAGIPVVAAPAPTNRHHRQAGSAAAEGSGANGNANAAAAAAAANHYLIYPVHFMAN